MKTKKVLVVEDDYFLSSAIYRALRKTFGDIELIWVATAEDAINQLLATKVDIVLSDFNLAGMKNGYDLWKYCDLRHRDVHFMLVSAVPFETILNHFENKLEAPPILPKPFRVEELVTLFRSCA